MDDVLILAGGFGERLWPASSKDFPKQFMATDNGKSFLAEAVIRALSIHPLGYIVVITRRDIASICISQLAPYSHDGRLVLLVEPAPRQTSAAIMSGICLCRFLARQAGCEYDKIKSRATLVLTSDHVISPLESFVKDCGLAESAARYGAANMQHGGRASPAFVCFSIPPTAPSTGYGYIKAAKQTSDGDFDIKPIEKFVEKPSLEIAKKYLADGGYSWNSGMFAFLSDTLLSEMQKCTPEVSAAYSKVTAPPPVYEKNGILIADNWTELNDAYQTVPKIAIDKSVAEKTERAVSVTAHFEWHDVGSWDTFASLCKMSFPDGGMAEVDGSGNFVYSDIPVALCGVSDLVVVVKNGALLVMKKGKSASVRDALHNLEVNK